MPDAILRAVALVLAHLCHIEAAFSEVDCAAIWHIGVKRGVVRRQEPLDALRAYSVPYKRNRSRARAIKSWPWGDIPGETDRHNRQWRAQREYAVRLLRGEVPDPCLPATDWNDKDSEPVGTMIEVCKGLAANRLYLTPATLHRYVRVLARRSPARSAP